MLPTLVVGWRASALRGEEAGCFREVACMSIVAAGGQFNSRQPSGLNKLAIELSGSVDAGFVILSCADILPRRP